MLASCQPLTVPGARRNPNQSFIKYRASQSPPLSPSPSTPALRTRLESLPRLSGSNAFRAAFVCGASSTQMIPSPAPPPAPTTGRLPGLLGFWAIWMVALFIAQPRTLHTLAGGCACSSDWTLPSFLRGIMQGPSGLRSMPVYGWMISLSVTLPLVTPSCDQASWAGQRSRGRCRAPRRRP